MESSGLGASKRNTVVAKCAEEIYLSPFTIKERSKLLLLAWNFSKRKPGEPLKIAVHKTHVAQAARWHIFKKKGNIKLEEGMRASQDTRSLEGKKQNFGGVFPKKKKWKRTLLR